MAKRRRKKKSYGKRKNRKRVSAGKKAYKKTGLYKYNQRRKKGGKRKKSYGKRKNKRYGKRKGSKRKKSRRYAAAPHSNKGHEIMQRLVNRGRSPQQAAKVAARIERMRAGKAKRYFENQAVQAKSATALSNVFANIGTAAHLANLTK